MDNRRLYSNRGKPIMIVGISSSKRAETDCAREDPISLFYLKIALKEAEKAGARTKLIDLRDLTIGACKECYSTCPAQCRFNERTFQCDCYYLKKDHMFIKDDMVPMEEAYDRLNKKQFFKAYNDKHSFAKGDDMWKVYKAMMEADGVIFATATHFYSRPALLQTMFSRFTALDGGVEKLWGDGKNLQNSIKYAKDPNAEYKQRMYGRWCAFINSSKEGDSVTPNLMKACTMMGMNIIPLAVAYRVNWYKDPTHRSDMKMSQKDPYSLDLAKHIGSEIVKKAKQGPRTYGIRSGTV